MVAIEKEYALYKGDDLLAMGTAREIAKELGISPSTVQFYGTPSYRKRSKSNNTRTLVILNEGYD